MAVVTRTGERRIWEYNNTLRTEGVPLPIVRGMAHDITERKQAERELRALEERFRRLVEALPDAILVHREDKIVFVNPFGMRLLGAQRPQELVGKNISEIIHPGSLASVQHRIRDCYRTGTANSPMEQVLISLDGSPVETEALAIPITWEGSPAIEVVIRDIRERKRAEETLREREGKFHQIADNIQEIFWMVDAITKQAIYVNPAFEQITGRTCASLQEAPLSYREIIHPEDRARVLNHLDEALKTGKFVEELRITRPDGIIRWVAAQGFPIRDEQGNIFRLAGVVQDITERKRAEVALQELQAELARLIRIATMGELTASIAHEINQPLTAVVTNGSASLRWLALQPPNLVEAQEAMTRTIKEANRASEVIGRIRALLQKASPQMEHLDVNEAIRNVLALTSNELVRGGVTVRTELAADLPAVPGDRVQVQQVMLNLIMNAIDAMSAVTDRPRKLLIRSATHPDGLLIQVRDSGTGIDPEHADRVFEPFFTTKPQGIGIGLSIGRSIVEAHGGRLWATPGSSYGTVFQFTLPKA